MQRRPLPSFVASSLLAAALVAACGGSGADSGAAPTASATGGKAGSTGFATGGAAGAAGTGGGFVLPAGCATESASAEVLPLDLYILLDRSGSMAYQNKWLDVTNALRGFVYEPASYGIGVGLQYLPLPQICDPEAYASPDVEIALLPGAQGALNASLANHAPDGDTPMVPALTGALSHAKSWASAHPTHTVAVLLVTDGLPDQTCQSTAGGKAPNDLAHANAAAAAGVAKDPKVSTYVIGVGNELAALGDIAKAGAGFAVFVDPTEDTQAQFRAAVDKIRKKVLPCSYAIPATKTMLDLGLVNVLFTNGAGTQSLFKNVKGAASCGNELAWYYDDPVKPTQLVMCPTACSLLKQDLAGKVSVVFGCATQTPE